MNGIPVLGLDSVRVNKSNEECIAAFTDACKRDVKMASVLLNDWRLSYPTLFILMPQIESFRLYPYLSAFKRTACGITEQILSRQDASSSVDGSGLLSGKNGMEYSALKWMLGTGYNESLSGEYDMVLDIAASVLINLYQDKSVLPVAADIIFSRSRAGRNIHDLAWAFFRSRDPEALKLIALHMDSEADSELACSLLGVEDTGAMAVGRRSGEYLSWFEENKEYLYFTDECFQLTGRPSIFGVDLERKYMQKRTQSRERQPIVPADTEEGGMLAAFRQLGGDEQAALAEYSHRLSGDKPKWLIWMALPLGEQLKEARQNGGRV